MSTVTRLFPAPREELPLEGLYLQHAVQRSHTRRHPRVYTNFIASMDGRIAVDDPATQDHGVPDSITNPRDWRLFQELAAQSDILLTSDRYLHELAAGKAQAVAPLDDDPAFADLHAWRQQQGWPRQPAIAVICASLDLPLATLAKLADRPVYVATGGPDGSGAIGEIQRSGARVLHTASEGKRVNAKRLVEMLGALGYFNIYSIAGPGVFGTLLEAGVLDRLYLTQVHRLIGGSSFDTLVKCDSQRLPANLVLRALYYDRGSATAAGQFFGVYDMENFRDSAD
jgi:riboflavin biosynthesis pyrimidine reductase